MFHGVAGEPGGRHARGPRPWRSLSAELVAAVFLLSAVGGCVSGVESFVNLARGRPTGAQPAVVVNIDPARQLADTFDTFYDTARRAAEAIRGLAASFRED